MEAHIQLTATLSLHELAQQICLHFSVSQRADLAKLIQADEDIEPSTAQILSNLKADYNALQNGTLKTRPLKDLLDEL